MFENKLQSLWRLRNERCYEELDTCNNHLIVAKNTILLKLMIHLINNIRCAARMEMKFRHKKGRGLRAAARPPVDPGQSPGWGLGGKAARYSYVLLKKNSISCKRNRVTSLFSSKHEALKKVSQVDLIQKRSHWNTYIVIIGEYFQNIL